MPSKIFKKPSKWSTKPYFGKKQVKELMSNPSVIPILPSQLPGEIPSPRKDFHAQDFIPWNYLPPSTRFTSMAVMPARAAFARGLLKRPPVLLAEAPADLLVPVSPPRMSRSNPGC